MLHLFSQSQFTDNSKYFLYHILELKIKIYFTCIIYYVPGTILNVGNSLNSKKNPCTDEDHNIAVTHVTDGINSSLKNS